MTEPSRQVRAADLSQPEPAAALGERPFWIAVALIEVIVLLVHLNALRTPHIEGDEAVFTFLAERLRESPGSYHVQGELRGEAARCFLDDVWEHRFGADLDHVKSVSLMQSPPDQQGRQHALYDPAIYDRPVFFHPPIYPYSLAIARSMLGSDGGPLLSSIVHCLTILLTAILGRMLISESAGVMAAALMAVESVSWVCGERLWIDGMLQAAVTGAALAALWSARTGGVWRFALAGAILGLAGLTKLAAGALAPAVLVWWLCGERKPRWGEIAAYLIACFVLVLPWLILMKAKYGSFLPAERPSEWLLELYPRIRKTVERPASYYLVGLLLVSPILVYCAVGWWRCWRERWLWMTTTWAATFIAAVTIIGLTGMGFQLRYLAPAMPALCLIAAGGLANLRWWWRIPAVALGAYTWYAGIHTALLVGAVDPAPVALSKYLDTIFDWNLAEWFPGMW